MRKRAQAMESLGSLYADHFRVNPDAKSKAGKFDQVQMERIVRLWEALYSGLTSSAASRRMHVDAFELAVLMSCVRTTAMQNRHGHIQISINRKSIDRFLTKLESHRKKAKRAWLASAAHKVYWDYQQRWHEFLIWIRTYLLYCQCNRTPQDSSAKRLRRYVRHCVGLAREGLKAERVIPPPEKELRRLVRLAMRYVRRERTYVTLGSLLYGRESGRQYLTEFVIVRLPAHQRRRTHRGVTY